MMISGGMPKILSEGPTPVTLFHHEYHIKYLGLNPRLQGENPAINRLSNMIERVKETTTANYIQWALGLRLFDVRQF
jgi:hypothetical protein